MLQSATNLFVQNVPPSADESTLQHHFGGIGPLRTVTVVRDGETGESRRFAFVRYAVAEHAAEALRELNGSMLSDRRLNITYAKPRQRSSKTADDANDNTENSKNTEKKKKRVDRKKNGLQGALAMRTVILEHTESLTDTGVRAIVKRNHGFEPESIILSADARSARITYANWSQAGRAAAAAHGKDGHTAVIEALAKGDRTTLIVRNLPFRVAPITVRKSFEDSAKVPVRGVRVVQKKGKNNDNGETGGSIDEEEVVDCAGFAFVEFFTVSDAKHAMNRVNGTHISGRPVAVDEAIDRKIYKKKTGVEEAGDGAKEGNDHGPSIEEKGAGDGNSNKNKCDIHKANMEVENSQDEADDDDQENDSDLDNDDNQEKENVPEKDEDIHCEASNGVNDSKKSAKSSPEELKRTVFLRNVPYECTGAEIWKVMEDKFGKVEQAVIVTNPTTGHSKGYAFVRFRSTVTARNAVPSTSTLSNEEGEKAGLSIRGRSVLIAPAVDRTSLKKVKADSANLPEKGGKRDVRNLRLADVGHIDPDSEEGRKIPAPDMEKRLKAEREKRQKLSRNPNAFVSDVRLSVRNLPRGVDERYLKGLFLLAAQQQKKDVTTGAKRNRIEERQNVARIVHCNIVRDHARSGRSLGFGFVQFERHEDALRALQALNNNTKAVDLVAKWAETERKRIQKMKQKQNEKLNNETNATAKKKGEDGDDCELDDKQVREMWGLGRRLMIDFSVEDKRQVQILERIKQRGVELREEHRRKKEAQARGEVDEDDGDETAGEGVGDGDEEHNINGHISSAKNHRSGQRFQGGRDAKKRRREHGGRGGQHDDHNSALKKRKRTPTPAHAKRQKRRRTSKS